MPALHRRLAPDFIEVGPTVDPRLTGRFPHEQRMIAFGEAEGIAWQRMPDGSIYRGAGHWHRVTEVQPGTHEVRECVR